MNRPRYRKIPYSSVVGTGVLDDKGDPAIGNLIVIIVPPSKDQAECERIAQVCADALNIAETNKIAIQGKA